jgi:hypothetical protein
MASLSHPPTGSAAYRRLHTFDFKVCNIESQFHTTDNLCLSASLTVDKSPSVTVVKDMPDHLETSFDPELAISNVFVDESQEATFIYTLAKNKSTSEVIGTQSEVISGSALYRLSQRSHPYSKTDEHGGGKTGLQFFVTWIAIRSTRYYTGPTSTALTSISSWSRSPSVYYIDADNEIHELASRNGSWIGGTVSKSSRTTPESPSARLGSPLTSWNYKTYDPRVFYIDTDNRVTGIFREGLGRDHLSSTYKSHQCLGTASPRTGLACYGYRDSASRVYFVDPFNILTQSSLDGEKWTLETLPGKPRDGGTPLACFGFGVLHTHIFFVDNESRLNETVRLGNSWVNNALPGGMVSLNSQVVCCGTGKRLSVKGASDIRVYYIDTDSFVNEMRWVEGNWTNNVLPGTANKDCGALACFAVSGTEPRVYFLDPDNRVNELAYAEQWTNTVLPGRNATSSTSLTCFGNNSETDARVYYLDINDYINETAWVDGHWESSVVF